MPKGPQGQRRPADVIGTAIMVAKIATGEIADSALPTKNLNAVELGKLGGKKGGRARADKLTPEKRKEIAKKAAAARWKK